MKYSHYEEVPVWKTAIEFPLNLFEFTSCADFRGFGDTKNQLERAPVSISNNIKGSNFLPGKERGKIVPDKEHAEFDAEMAKFLRQHLKMLQKRQQDTAIVGAAGAAD